MMRRILPLFFLVIAAVRLFAGEDFPSGFADCVPAPESDVFFLNLSKIRSVPLFRSLLESQNFAEEDFFRESGEAAFIFGSGETVLLLRSETLSEKEFRKKTPPDAVETLNGRTVFRFDGASAALPGRKTDCPTFITFPGEGILAAASGQKELAEIHAVRKAGKNNVKELSQLTNHFLACGLLRSGKLPNGTPFPEGIAKILFSLSYLRGMPSPVTAEVLLIPRAEKDALNVYRDAKKYVDNAYAAGALLGPVRPEMKFAFRVSLSGSVTRIDVSLTDADAKDFLLLLLDQMTSIPVKDI